RGTIEIFPNAVENSVYERTRLSAAKSFGELYRFVNRNHRRNVVAIEHFVDRESQNIAIDGRNAVEIVVLAIFFDALVDFRQVFDHSFDQWLGEFAHARLDRTEFPKVVDAFGSFPALKVAPEMVLNGRLPSAMPFPHTVTYFATARSRWRFRPRCARLQCR